MNIFVINPPNLPYTNPSILAEPLDVLLLAEVIKKRHKNVCVLDMDVDRLENDISGYLKEKNIVIFVYDYQIPLHTTEAMNNIFEIIKNNKKKNTKYIMVGKTSAFFKDEFLNHGIDIIIKGIAEPIINDVIDNIDCIETLKEIPNLIIKEKDKVIETKKHLQINKFNTFPIPNRSFLDINKYMDTRTIITSRGCIGKCRFCSTPYSFGLWSGKDYKQVVDEIEMLVKKYKTKKILFLDDNMTVDKKRVFQICEEIKRRNIKCLFGCLSSIKCYDKSMFQVMYDVGFRWVHFGIESGSERILKLMNKEMNLSYVKQVINEIKEMGYRVRCSFILDYPTTKKEDVVKTKELIYALAPHEIRLHYLAYRVFTPIYDTYKNRETKTQYIHSNMPNHMNDEIIKEINEIKEMLKENGYELIEKEIDWKKYNNKEKDFKVAAFTPIKYGMCWYE